MVNIKSETLIPLSKAPSIIPGRPHVSTLHRWVGRGVLGVKLDTVMIGGRRYTSHEAIERFTEASTIAASSGHSLPAATPKQREAAIARAEAELA